MSALSPSEVIDVLDADSTVEKCASWEAFESTILGDGNVEVVNSCYDGPGEHTYTVQIEGGIPSDCICPAWEYQESPSGHMASITIPMPLLEALSTKPTINTDGGVTVETDGVDYSDERPDDCNCVPLVEDLPYRPCYREGSEYSVNLEGRH